MIHGEYWQLLPLGCLLLAYALGSFWDPTKYTTVLSALDQSIERKVFQITSQYIVTYIATWRMVRAIKLEHWPSQDNLVRIGTEEVLVKKRY